MAETITFAKDDAGLKLRGVAYAATAAVQATALRGSAAIGAMAPLAQAGAINTLAVNLLMAVAAKRNAVINVIAQFGMMRPSSFVVGLNVVGATALLALEIVALVHGLAPSFVAPRVALAVAVGLAGCSIAAGLAAVLIRMPALLLEVAAAVGAGEHGRYTRARCETGSASQLHGLCDGEGVAALAALANDGVPVRFSHINHYNTIWTLERLSGLGLTPELANA